jgi:CRP-like cAMP-binding protein
MSGGNSPTTPADDLAKAVMFAGLDGETLSRLAEAAVPRSFRRGQLLCVEGEPGESLLVLRSGSAVVFRTAPSGERAVLAVVRAPDVLGEVALLDRSPRSASIEALEDITALALSRQAFLELAYRNPKVLDTVLAALGALVRRLTDQTADHVFLDLPGRVAKALVRLAEHSEDHTVELTQSQLADMVGGSRQSVNQALSTFAARGWLRTRGRRIVALDMAGLRRRAGLSSRG